MLLSYSSILGCQMRGWEEEDCWENVEEVEDGRGKHQSMEVPLHNWAKGEVDQAAEVANQAKDANDHLHESESEKTGKWKCEHGQMVVWRWQAYTNLTILICQYTLRKLLPFRRNWNSLLGGGKFSDIFTFNFSCIRWDSFAENYNVIPTWLDMQTSDRLYCLLSI